MKTFPQRVWDRIAKAVQNKDAAALSEEMEAEAGEAEGLLLINVVYRVPATNSRFNLVYPFYLNEGAQALP